MSHRRTPKKWDASICRELLATAKGKDKLQVKVLTMLAGVLRPYSMLRKVMTIRNLPDKKRDMRIATLNLTPEAFGKLAAFCKTVSDQCWRPYTTAEEAVHWASREFQILKRFRKPEEWVSKVKTLPKNERAHSACVLWWDMFADRLVSERFKGFDQWIIGFKKEQCLSTATLRKNLVACGYPELVAERRVMGEEFEPEETETV